MSIAAIRTAVYNAVNGTTNAGKVHDYERWSSTWDAFLGLFKTTVGGVPQIRGWMVAYRGLTPQEPMEFGFSHMQRHQFKVIGFFGVDDSAETEKTASNLAGAVVNSINTDATLHGATYYETEPAAMTVFEPRVVGSPQDGVLCHYTEIDVFTWEQESA